jgi:DNA invertase Pin-like site-specific DNA recombinase
LLPIQRSITFTQTVIRENVMSIKGKRFVSYLRVSTTKQGESGLGLEAQRAAVARYVAVESGRIVAELIEVESGKQNARPQLAAALASCRRHCAVLVIAKLDRLGRNVHFISGLMESGVDFVAADVPDKDRFMLHIRAAFAEEEARKISERTKAALAAAKARGAVLGGAREGAYAIHVHAKDGNAVSAAMRQAKAADRAAGIAPVVEELRADGAVTLAQLAAGLDGMDIPAPRGGKWAPVQVSRLLKQIEGKSA